MTFAVTNNFSNAGTGWGTYTYGTGNYTYDPTNTVVLYDAQSTGYGNYRRITSSFQVEFNQLMKHSTLSSSNVRAYSQDENSHIFQITNPDINNFDPADEYTVMEISNPNTTVGIAGFILNGDNIQSKNDSLCLDGNDGPGGTPDGALQCKVKKMYDSNGNGRYDDYYYYTTGTVPDGP